MTHINFSTVDLWGYFGGGVLAICMTPQLYKIWSTRSAEDLSYTLLFLYVLGITFKLVYFIEKGALAGWVLGILELFLTIVVALSKFIVDFENEAKYKRESPLQIINETATSSNEINGIKSQTGTQSYTYSTNYFQSPEP